MVAKTRYPRHSFIKIIRIVKPHSQCMKLKYLIIVQLYFFVVVLFCSCVVFAVVLPLLLLYCFLYSHMEERLCRIWEFKLELKLITVILLFHTCMHTSIRLRSYNIVHVLHEIIYIVIMLPCTLVIPLTAYLRIQTRPSHPSSHPRCCIATVVIHIAQCPGIGIQYWNHSSDWSL